MYIYNHTYVYIYIYVYLIASLKLSLQPTQRPCQSKVFGRNLALKKGHVTRVFGSMNAGRTVDYPYHIVLL